MSKSQNEQVLARLKRGPLTPIEALREIGTLRLAARVSELKDRGHEIESRLVEVPGGRHVAEYRLVRS